MNDQQHPGSSDDPENEQDSVADHSREDERDEAIREGLTRDNELEHAIDEDAEG